VKLLAVFPNIHGRATAKEKSIMLLVTSFISNTFILSPNSFSRQAGGALIFTKTMIDVEAKDG
jgi:hypothetical protein